tara:strand:+ start:17023 stop:17616 length:594 start_codon:yes stop_codon:yes gene_type:complete
MIIAISGKAGAGKTLSASILYNMFKELPKYNTKLKSFAKPVYQIASVILNQKVSHIQDNKLKQAEPYNMTNREFLQLIGQSFRDLVDVNMWNNILFQDDYDDEADIIIIDDLRYRTEIDYIRMIGQHYLFRVQRELDDNQHKFRLHKSETDLDKVVNWNSIIDNTKDIETLSLKLKNQVFLPVIEKLNQLNNNIWLP